MKKITVSVAIQAPIEKVWNYFTIPEHIKTWNTASEEWHSPKAENDLRPGGHFSYRMEAKDGSVGFDFGGVYDEVVTGEKIAFTLGDGRKVNILFAEVDGITTVNETFEPESENSIELQQQGWQAIMDSFRRYTESH